jgi:hypothetical protein
MVDIPGPGKITGDAGQRSSYFPTLMVCMLLSISLLAISRFIIDRLNGGLPNWLSVFGAMAPLLYYHLGYLAPRTKAHLSQAAIDSVYYYGFLVTIFALGTSALSMVSSGSVLTDPGSVIAQFGVGLLATGYAIVARLHLSSASNELGDASPDAVIDQYICRSRDLVERLDRTLHSFDELAAKCAAAVQSVEKITQENVRNNSEALKGLAETFQRELVQVFAQTKEGLIEVRGMVSDVAFVDERKVFVRNIKTITDGTARLNTEFQNLTNVSQEAAAATKAWSTESQSLCGSLGAIGSNLNEVAVGAKALGTALKTTEQNVTSSVEEADQRVIEGDGRRPKADDRSFVAIGKQDNRNR